MKQGDVGSRNDDDYYLRLGWFHSGDDSSHVTSAAIEFEQRWKEKSGIADCQDYDVYSLAPTFLIQENGKDTGYGPLLRGYTVRGQGTGRISSNVKWLHDTVRA